MELALRDTLVFLEYLDSGLIPIKGFHPESIEDFEKLLTSLSGNDRRVANRKFRKIFRKIAAREMARKTRPTAGWEQTYGVGSASPSKIQLRNRRRLVHDEICDAIRRKIEDEY